MTDEHGERDASDSGGRQIAQADLFSAGVADVEVDPDATFRQVEAQAECGGELRQVRPTANVAAIRLGAVWDGRAFLD